MNKILMKLINYQITDKDISDGLSEICDKVHSSCDEECPVFEKNDGVPWTEDQSNCKCFKNGDAMLEFLREDKTDSKDSCDTCGFTHQDIDGARCISCGSMIFQKTS